jgi:hypothetical protein
MDHAVPLYHCFTLSSREVEEVLAERVFHISYERSGAGYRFRLITARNLGSVERCRAVRPLHELQEAGEQF